MSTRFTPGPWIKTDDHFDGNVITSDARISDSLAAICKCDVHWDEPFASEQFANAALIADAPAMYALLSKLVAFNETDSLNDQLSDPRLREECASAYEEAAALLARHES